jgi:hypothetical protein
MALMDLTAVIASFATGTYTVTRPGADTYDTNGRLVAGSTSTFSVEACVQPVTGRALDRLPEGLRQSEVVSVWAPLEMRNRDTFVYEGETWQVQESKDWNTLGGYWRGHAVKVSQP